MYDEINAIRLANLRKLIRKHDGPLSLSKQCGYASSSYLVQMAGPNPDRVIGEKTARRIEHALGLEWGWLDTPNADETLPLIDSQRLMFAVERVLSKCEDADLPTSPKRIAKMVTLAYESEDAESAIDAHIKLLKELSL